MEKGSYTYIVPTDDQLTTRKNGEKVKKKEKKKIPS